MSLAIATAGWAFGGALSMATRGVVDGAEAEDNAAPAAVVVAPPPSGERVRRRRGSASAGGGNASLPGSGRLAQLAGLPAVNGAARTPSPAPRPRLVQLAEAHHVQNELRQYIARDPAAVAARMSASRPAPVFVLVVVVGLLVYLVW